MLPPSSDKDVLDILGRVDQGYNATPADGTCGYIAALQTMFMDIGLVDDAVLPAAQASLKSVLREVGHKVCGDGVIRAAWTKNEDRQFFFSQLNSRVDGEDNRLKDCATDDEVRNLIEKTGQVNGPWISSHLISALAVVLSRDIVVVTETSVTLYPQASNRYSLGHADPETASRSTALGIYVGSLNNQEAWLPIVAFHPSTLVIVYDNIGHFWCTRRSKDHDQNKLMAAFGVERVKDIYVFQQWPSTL